MRGRQAQVRYQPSSGRRVMARPLGEPMRASVRRRRRGMPGLRRWVGPAVLLVIAGVAVALLAGLPGGVAQTGGIGALSATTPGTPTASASDAGGGTVRNSVLPGPSRAPPSPPASADPDPVVAPPTPVATPSPSPTATPRPKGAAPASADEFDVDGQVIDMAFPFKPDVRYRYRDNWGDRRPGQPLDYNHLQARRDGELVRVHDGIDIYVRSGTPVIAPFAGVVIDPAERWQPWERKRYGETVVIVSDEPLSEGYAALLTHLEVAFVEPGEVVRRGEVVGLAGNTGNAEDSAVHLHFELRAPFLIEWPVADETRLVDAFNPYPSLVAADPRAAD